jgi:cytoskeletal protein CcmA (bactofilin family)
VRGEGDGMKRKTSSESSKLDTLIGPNTTLEGSIKTEGSLTVEGQIRGKVEAKGEVLVGGAGKVEADIFADAVMVAGEIVGEIVARRRLEITNTGSVIGDVRAASITVKEGGKVDGSFKMKVDSSVRRIGETPELQVVPFEVEEASSSE